MDIYGDMQATFGKVVDGQKESAGKSEIDKTVIADLKKENREIKDLFVDLTFCYLNPEITKTMYAEVIRQFKEIVGDDREFVNSEQEQA
jgi:hypothetical protein